MKRIATEARQDIVKLLEKPVFLDVYIKVRKGWSRRPCGNWAMSRRGQRILDARGYVLHASPWRESS